MKCLIIAAGKGSRLRSLADPKPLAPLLGVPLIERVIRLASDAGADDFYVVIGYQGARVRSFLENLSIHIGLPITAIENDEWEKANGVSVLKANKVLKEPFLLLMADHLFDPDIARQLKTFPMAGNEIVLAVDSRLQNPMVDLDDVTRVLIEKDRIKSIGKGIKEYNCFDTGIFFCNPVIFSALEESSRRFNDHSLSGGVRVLAGEGRARTMTVNGLFWIDIDEPESFRRAEAHLSRGPQQDAR